MPVSYNSAARNLFLLGSSGQQVAQNFFKYIDKDNGTGDGYIDVEQIRYIESDEKYVIAGSGRNLNLVSYGFFDKRDYNQETTTTTLDYETRIVSTDNNAAINFAFLENLHVDSNGDLIVCGNVNGTTPWIGKYSYSTGVVQWQSTSNQGGINYRSVTSDSTGYYACGYSGLTGEAVVEKYDLNGNPLWGKKVSTVGGSSNKIQLFGIACNSRGQLVAVGDIVDLDQTKGYMIKFTTSGEFLWDKSLQADIETSSFDHQTRLDGIHIDDKDQIYVVGHIQSTFGFFRGSDRTGWIGKYSAEGNLIWQRESNNGAGTHMSHRRVFADNQTEQVIVLGYWSNTTEDGAALSKYSKNGTLLWRRSLISDSSSFVDNPVLDADSSFYYLAFVDEDRISITNTPEGYVFGKVSTSGNGLGAFQYPDGTGINQGYEILNITDKIGRLDDGSVRFDSSDLRKTPFSANHIIFDDYATQVTKKKVNIKDAGVIQYSGSPAIRPADFETREYTTDEYGVPPQKNYIGLSESLSPASTNTSPTPNNTWTRQSTNVNITANDIANPLGVGVRAEKYNISATSGRRLEYGVPAGVFVAGQTYTYSWWMKAITTNAQWNFQVLYAGASNSTISFADRDGNILENVSSSTVYKPTDTEWHRVVWTFTANNTGSGAIGGYNENNETGDLWYLWGAQLVDGPNPLRYYTNNANNTPENAAGTEHAPDIVSGAYNFDQSEILQIGEIPGDFSEMTVEIWFKSDTLSNWQNPIDCNYHVNNATGTTQSGNIGPRLEINASGNCSWYWGAPLDDNNRNFPSPGAEITTGVWNHAVLSIAGPLGSDGSAYINGEFVGTGGQNGTAGNTWYGEIRNLILGRGFVLASRYFDGQVGEVRIYPKALRAEQVFQNYNATKSKYINEAPDTAPRIGPGIVTDSNLLLNYDFGNRATYNRAHNLYDNSTNYGSSNWNLQGPNGVTTNTTDVLSPVGDYTATKWQPTTTLTQYIYDGIGAMGTETHTMSVWVRAADGETTTFAMNLFSPTQNPSDFTATDKWQRFTWTFTPQNQANAYPVIVRELDKALYIWGPQIEKASTAGNYVPTYATSVGAPTTVKNLSSNSFPGTINGATFNPAGYFEFDGTNDYIQSSSVMAPGSADFSVVFWYKITGTGGRGGLFERAASSPFSGWVLGQGGTNNWSAAVRDSSNNNVAFQYTFPTVDEWTCDAFTWDVSTQTLTPYRNGANAGTATNTGTVGSLDGNTRYPMVIGGRLDSALAQYKPMECGEVQMYSKVLTAAEVSQNFNATRGKYGV